MRFNIRYAFPNNETNIDLKKTFNISFSHRVWLHFLWVCVTLCVCVCVYCVCVAYFSFHFQFVFLFRSVSSLIVNKFGNFLWQFPIKRLFWTFIEFFLAFFNSFVLLLVVCWQQSKWEKKTLNIFQKLRWRSNEESKNKILFNCHPTHSGILFVSNAITYFYCRKN